MKRPLQIFFVFSALSLFLFNCGNDSKTTSDPLSESESTLIPDGSAFMALERLSDDRAFVTVDLENSAIASYLNNCHLDVQVQGMDTQTSSGLAVESLAGFTIWDSDVYGDVVLDSDSATYPADGENQIAELLISDSYFSFDEPINATLRAVDCEQTGFLFEIEETLN